MFFDNLIRSHMIPPLLPSQLLLRLSWSFATLLRTSEKLFRRTARHVVQMTRELDSQHLANIAWSYELWADLGALVGWGFGWLGIWLVGDLVGWFVGLLVGLLVCWLVGWFVGALEICWGLMVLCCWRGLHFLLVWLWGSGGIYGVDW